MSNILTLQKALVKAQCLKLLRQAPTIDVHLPGTHTSTDTHTGAFAVPDLKLGACRVNGVY